MPTISFSTRMEDFWNSEIRHCMLLSFASPREGTPNVNAVHVKRKMLLRLRPEGFRVSLL